jgi:GNAT superfamily N-acetyltransferase
MSQALPAHYAISPASRAHTERLFDWARGEGWNPGITDLEVAWSYQPTAFMVLTHAERMIGGGSIMAYAQQAGFMGLFIMDPAYRGRGLGQLLWHERLKRLQARLTPHAPIAMAGVHHMVPFYQKGGFYKQYDLIRHAGEVASDFEYRLNNQLAAVDLLSLPTLQIQDFLSALYGDARLGFWQHWFSATRQGGTSIGLLTQGSLIGLACLRPAQVGFKLGPVFALDSRYAIVLLGYLLSKIPGQQVQIDVPSYQVSTQQWLNQQGLKPGFSCAYLVHPNGASAALAAPAPSVFGVTSLEFG